MTATKNKWLLALRLTLAVVALFHLSAGGGLMFSVSFQRMATSGYGAHLELNAQQIYFLRIIGTFAFAMGVMAAMAARDPLRNPAVLWGFVTLFLIRNVQRHWHADELFAGFAVSPAMNLLTTLFFLLMGGTLLLCYWKARRSS